MKKGKKEYLNNKNLELNMKSFFEIVSKLKEIKLGLAEDISRGVHDIKIKKHIKDLTSLYKDLELIQENLGKDFYELSKRIVGSKNWFLLDKEEAIQESVMICFQKIEKFDFSRGSAAFSYLTTCIIHHLKQLHRTVKNHNELKKKYIEFVEVTNNNMFVKNGREALDLKGKNQCL